MAWRRVYRWKGGELRVVSRGPRMIIEPGEDPATIAGNPPIETVDWGLAECVPFGRGFALLKEGSSYIPEGEDYAIRLEVRDGRAQCVAIEVKDGGPSLTKSRLKNFPLPELERWAVTHTALRLWKTEEGEIVGETALSSQNPLTTWDRVVADITNVYDEAKRKSGGRKELSDGFLRDVATEYKDALASGLPTGKAINKRFGPVTDDNARRWVAKARARGFLPPTEPRKARG